MADALPKEQLDSAADPAEVAGQTFDAARRGFDQSQVRAYLIEVAEALGDAQQREAEMRSRLGKAVRRAEQAETSARELPADDPSALTRQLGEEVAGVLDAARVAGEQKVAAAEKSAERLLASAKQEATEVRRAAETIMDERRAEADAAAEELMAACRAEADGIVEQARTDAATLRKDAADDVARAQREGDALIREAEEARVQILQDMDRRRRQARAQIERLRVGRDRLLRSYEVVRRTLDESTGELKSSLKEAKVLGDTAARRVASEGVATPHQLEAELADARLVGRGPGETSSGSGPATRRPSSPTTATDQPKARRKAAPAPQAPTAPATRSGSAGGPAPTTPAIQVPHVELPGGGLSGPTAPSPRRPAMHEGGVPRPPATAPLIKQAEATEPTEPTEPVSVPAVAELNEGAEAAAVEAKAGAATVALPVPTITLERTLERTADPEGDSESGDEAETAPMDDATEFADLPVEELAIIEASDDIEEVVALVPETVELGSDEIVTWVPADLAELVEAPADEAEVAEVEAAEPEVAEVEVAEVEAAEPEVAEAEVESTEPEVAEVEVAEVESTEPEAAPSLFAALRAQAGTEAEPEAVDVEDQPEATEPELAERTEAEHAAAEATEADLPDAELAEASSELGDDQAAAEDLARQRDAIVADLTVDLEKRLKRALADEQNDVLTGIRSAGRRKRVALIDLVGETDSHVTRYVTAVTEVAAQAYGAGAALLDREAEPATMPAGAVEELIGSAVVLPLRLRLLELDSLNAAEADAHIDAVRGFYRQRKTDHLTDAAADLAALLVTAGACNVLESDERLPWLLPIG